jgi:hypothetical protein
MLTTGKSQFNIITMDDSKSWSTITRIYDANTWNEGNFTDQMAHQLPCQVLFFSYICDELCLKFTL